MRNGFLLHVVLASALLLAPAILCGQQAPPVEQETLKDAQHEKLTEVEALKLQLSLEKKKRLAAQFNEAIAQCQTQKSIRGILDELDQTDSEQAAMLIKAFADHKVDNTKNKVDVTTFEFVPNK